MRRRPRIQRKRPSSNVSLLRGRYAFTGRFYDILDAPWERLYRRWRPELTAGLGGRILETGFGTGRNAEYYADGANVTAVDLSEVMLLRGKRRAAEAGASVLPVQADAALLPFPDETFDSCLSTFLYCVLPEELQGPALIEMARVIRPGGLFRLVEIVYSRRPFIRLKQAIFAPYVGTVFGARFDRRTREVISSMEGLEVLSVRPLKDDTHILIEGRRRRSPRT